MQRICHSNPLVARSKTDISQNHAGPSEMTNGWDFRHGRRVEAPLTTGRVGKYETHVDDPPLRLAAALMTLLAGAAPVFADDMREAALEKRIAQLEQQLNELKSMVQAQKSAPAGEKADRPHRA